MEIKVRLDHNDQSAPKSSLSTTLDIQADLEPDHVCEPCSTNFYLVQDKT